MSESTLSPTIAASSARTSIRPSASSKSGGSGLPITTGRAPEAAATASTTAPHPGRKSPPSRGSRGSRFGVTKAAPAAMARDAAVSRS